MVLVRFWVYFHTFFKLNTFEFIWAKKHGLSVFGPHLLDQKAWPIAHGFGPILGHFHTFFKITNNLFGSILDHFGPKSMAYSPWFWSILGHFHTFFKLINAFHLVSIFLAILDQKAWPIAHGFGSDFGSFSHLFQFCGIINFHRFYLAILDQKAWPIAHGFGPILGHFHTFFNRPLIHALFLYRFLRIHFGPKSMAYSPWFWSDFGSFSHLFQEL